MEILKLIKVKPHPQTFALIILLLFVSYLIIFRPDDKKDSPEPTVVTLPTDTIYPTAPPLPTEAIVVEEQPRAIVVADTAVPNTACAPYITATGTGGDNVYVQANIGCSDSQVSWTQITQNGQIVSLGLPTNGIVGGWGKLTSGPNTFQLGILTTDGQWLLSNEAVVPY